GADAASAKSARGSRLSLLHQCCVSPNRRWAVGACLGKREGFHHGSRPAAECNRLAMGTGTATSSQSRPCAPALHLHRRSGRELTKMKMPCSHAPRTTHHVPRLTPHVRSPRRRQQGMAVIVI